MKRNLFLALLVMGMMCSCGGGSDDPSVPEVPDKPVIPENPDNPDNPVLKREVKIASRTSEGDFEKGAQMGIYMVSYAGSESASLKGKGNYIDNACFTFEGNDWKASQTYYWEDEEKKADFFAYAPYKKVTEATNCPIQVEADQQSEDKFKHSDFLWGKTVGQLPSDNTVGIVMDHLMSKVLIRLEPAAGVTKEELENTELKVSLLDLKTHAKVHLGTGKLTNEEQVETILPFCVDALNYQAILLPQQVEKGKLVEVFVNKDRFTLESQMNLEPGKQYTITAKISRNTVSFGVTVNDWVVVDGDFGGNMNPDFE